MAHPRNLDADGLPSSVPPVVRQALAKARTRLQEIYSDRLVRVILYGSQARGEATDESDVDVLVVLEGPVDTYREIKRLVRLETELFDRYDLHFAFQPYDAVTYQRRRRRFIRNVHADGVEL